MTITPLLHHYLRQMAISYTGDPSASVLIDHDPVTRKWHISTFATVYPEKDRAFAHYIIDELAIATSVNPHDLIVDTARRAVLDLCSQEASIERQMRALA